MLSANTVSSQQYRCLIRFSSAPAPSASWMSAAWTATPSRRPEVSTATWRFLPLTLFAAS